MKPSMVYDSGCPVCQNYMLLVKHKVGESMDYVKSDGAASDFQYRDASGKQYNGAKAIERLASDFPAVKDYMWMLPQEYKTAGLKVAYKVGSVIRKAVSVVRKGCNCGGKK